VEFVLALLWVWGVGGAGPYFKSSLPHSAGNGSESTEVPDVTTFSLVLSPAEIASQVSKGRC